MIRVAQLEDASAIHEAIVESLGYVNTTLEVVRQRLTALAGDDRCLSLVWVDDATGQVAGFIHALRYDTLHSEGGWDVISLAVIPAWQGRGVGRQLLSELEAQVAARGGRYVRLNSRVERTAAHGFYEHLGYDCDKQQKRFIKRLG